MIGMTVVLFVLGLLPMIDNYAHLVGFGLGLLLGFALMPYVRSRESDRKGKQQRLLGTCVWYSGCLDSSLLTNLLI